MSVTVIIRIDREVGTVEQAEAAHPDLMARLRVLSRQCGLIGHRRLVRPREVLDVAEFDTEENYRHFTQLGAEDLAEYDRAVGVTTVVTVWQSLEADK